MKLLLLIHFCCLLFCRWVWRFSTVLWSLLFSVFGVLGFHSITAGITDELRPPARGLSPLERIPAGHGPSQCRHTARSDAHETRADFCLLGEPSPRLLHQRGRHQRKSNRIWQQKNQTFNYHSTDCLAFQVCFVCRKTRFSVFGSWWHNCKLCRRTICTKCCTKVNKSKAKQSKHRTPHHSAFQSTCGCTDADTIGTICQRARLHFVQRPIDVSHAVFPLLQPPD